MNRNEFIAELKSILADDLPASEIDNNISYYDAYIREQSALSTEEQVLEQLGAPRLIAKTIIETYQLAHGPLYHNGVHRMDYQDSYAEDWKKDEPSEDEYANTTGYEENESSYRSFGNYQLKWYHKLLMGIIAVLLLIVIVVIGGIIIRIFLTIGIPLLLIYFFYRLIVNNRKG